MDRTLEDRLININMQYKSNFVSSPQPVRWDYYGGGEKVKLWVGASGRSGQDKAGGKGRHTGDLLGWE